MTTSGAPPRRTRSGRGAAVTQLPTHARLLRDVSGAPHPPVRAWRGRPDAIIVPATRPASALAGLVEVAAQLETTLVVLCSRQANVEQVAHRIGRVSRARGLVIAVDDAAASWMPVFGTSAAMFGPMSGGRASDLSLKRNLGLLLARLRGWQKVVFVDDDITLSRSDVTRIVHQLESHQFAGMMCRDFPDNSVVCHARRLAGFYQDVFVTGAVLGVNTSDVPLPFFPDVYNEDWFFFGEAAARHRLIKAGEARQAAYQPFAEPARAGHEEFGDLLAEGMYSLIETQGPGQSFRQITHLANARYWSSFIDARMCGLDETTAALERLAERRSSTDVVHEAVKSLEQSTGRYGGADRITADHCVDFLRAWERDAVEWGKLCARTNAVGAVRDAMDRLGVSTWLSVR